MRKRRKVKKRCLPDAKSLIALDHSSSTRSLQPLRFQSRLPADLGRRFMAEHQHVWVSRSFCISSGGLPASRTGSISISASVAQLPVEDCRRHSCCVSARLKEVVGARFPRPAKLASIFPRGSPLQRLAAFWSNARNSQPAPILPVVQAVRSGATEIRNAIAEARE